MADPKIPRKDIPDIPPDGMSTFPPPPPGPPPAQSQLSDPQHQLIHAHASPSQMPPHPVSAQIHDPQTSHQPPLSAPRQSDHALSPPGYTDPSHLQPGITHNEAIPPASVDYVDYASTHSHPPVGTHVNSPAAATAALPPIQTQHSTPSPHQHSNDTPIPEYNPAEPLYAPPPSLPQDPPSDDEQKHGKSKGWSQRMHQLSTKAAGPINQLANKMGAQGFLPMTMDKECEKAASILKAFCKEGVTTNADQPKTPIQSDIYEQEAKSKPKSSKKILLTIPQKVIAKAVGLAIFTTARMGFHISGATGSGILVARLPDGTWSPPSGIQVHALGAGLMIGVDIYDCVCVINSREALSAFMHTRVSLGPEVAVAAGPYGAGGGMEFGAARTPRSDVKQGEVKGDKTAAPTSAVPAHAGEGTSSRETDQLKPDKGHHRRSSSSALKPVFSYVKSRGFYAGVQIDGTVVTERKEANAEFYGENVSVDQILKGDVSPQEDHKLWPGGAKVLVDALNRAQDRKPEEVIVSGTDPSLPVVSVTSPSTASQDLPPPYVDDGRPHPGVGDQKVTYG